MVSINVGGHRAQVDAEYRHLAEHRWTPLVTKGKVYACRKAARKTQYLHVEVARLAGIKGQEIDHKNGDGLDCRRDNLRGSTHQQNTFNRGPQKNNRSGYKGVTWSKRDNKWLAQIQVNGTCRYIGLFERAIDAARAYDRVASGVAGEFARLNGV